MIQALVLFLIIIRNLLIPLIFILIYIELNFTNFIRYYYMFLFTIIIILFQGYLNNQFKL